jgi:dual specificity tyrosine-phosphorylation-regulated kinase 2/3/4
VSGLPRAAGRSVSSKQDAVAGAAAAMGSMGRRA